jgi:NADPH2:quinone reductase
MAGVVEELGPGVTAFHARDEVYGMVGGVGGLLGTLAEYVVANADLLALKPNSLSMCEAAALPLIAITAWEGTVDRAKVTGAKRSWFMQGRVASGTSPCSWQRHSARRPSLQSRQINMA